MQKAKGQMQKAAHGVLINLGLPTRAEYATGVGVPCR
jgi:hypothetical protein